MSTMIITSPSFKHNGAIPKHFTCDGANVNPALVIGGIPPGSKTLALIVDDPDAPRGDWVHWLVWNIDPGTKEIREDSIPPGAEQGVNDFRNRGYGGPCPPSGTHRYFFKLYALDRAMDLGQNAAKADLEAAMRGHIVEQTEMIGLYRRK